jgi:two-component system sensor kinase FixL
MSGGIALASDALGEFLNALPVPIAILDRVGKIVHTNESWRQGVFADACCSQSFSAGADYLEACLAVDRGGKTQAEVIGLAIQQALNGQRSTFLLEIAGSTLEENHSYWVIAAPLEKPQQGAVIIHLDVSERRRAEKALQDSERRFRAVVEQCWDMVFIAAPDGTISYASAAVKRVLGFSVEEMVGRNITAFFHPDDLELGTGALAQQLDRPGISPSIEFRCAHQDGSWRWIEGTSVNLLADPAVRGLIFNFRDITEKKQACAAGRRSEQLYDDLFETALDAIVIVAPDTSLLALNPAGLAMTGWRAEEWLGKSFLPLIHPEHLPQALDCHQRVLRGEQVSYLELPILKREGDYTPLEFTVTPQFEGSQVVSMLCIGRDMAKRNAAARALQQSEERYRALAEDSTDMIARMSIVGIYLDVSPACRKLLGYEPEELVGRSMSDLFELDDWLKLIVEHAHVLRLREPFTATYRLRRKDGSFIWIEATNRILHDSQTGRALEIICVSRDITDRKRAEELIDQHKAQLAHLSRLSSMGEMATGMAHELNQPLTAIAHYADACLQWINSETPEPDKPIVDWTRRILEQANRAGAIIRRVKDFVRKSGPQRSATQFHDLALAAIQLLETDARHCGARIHTEIPEQLPLVWVDPIQIEQVLVNLLRNAFEALEHTEPAQRVIIVRASAVYDEILRDEVVEAAVEDRGSGIPAEHLEQVFEPFFTSRPDGMGMGLAISRSILESHGGRLWVTPNPGPGATFHFTLPVRNRENMS